MANKSKHNKVFAIIYVVVVVLVLVAVVGVIVHFTRNNETPPAEEGALAVSIDGKEIATGGEAGTIESGSVIAVSGATGCNVAVYAYCPKGVDFEIIVDGETYYWSEFSGLNVTDGFTFNAVENGFEIQFDNFYDIISKSQGGADVKSLDTFVDNIFRMVISAEEKSFDFTFSVPPVTANIILSQEHLVF